MLDRSVVLDSIRRLAPAASFSTSCLAAMTGEPERAVRACVSWLTLAGVLVAEGHVTRHDHMGVPYRAKCYRLTGRDLPAGRVKQDRIDREVALRTERDRATRASAADWLSRRWTTASP